MQLRQLRRCEAVYGLRVAHFLDDSLGRHTFLTHLDNLIYRDRLGLFEQRRTATQQGNAGQKYQREALPLRQFFEGLDHFSLSLSKSTLKTILRRAERSLIH